MQMKEVCANKFTQTTGGNYASWSNLSNLMWYAHTDNTRVATASVRGYTLTPNRPATLTLTDFKCELPTGARVKKIVVRSSYNKKDYWSNGNTCEPGKPTISFVGVNGLGSQKGATTNRAVVLIRNEFQCDLDASVVNSSNFGIKFDFPRNQNNIRGYVIIRNLYLEIYYETPQFEVTMNKVKGEYRNDTYEVSTTISSKTDTTYVPSVTLTIPTGFVLENYTCKGNVTKEENVLTWTPALNRISSDTLLLELSTDISWGTSTSYTGTFTSVESYSSTQKTLNVEVQRYLPHGTETVTGEDAIKDEEYTWVFAFTDEEMTVIRDDSASGYVQFRYLDLNGNIQAVSVANANWPTNNEYTVTMTPTTLGEYPIRAGCYTDTTLVDYFYETDPYIKVIPDEEDARNICLLLLPVTQEELDRLGEGEIYTAQTWLRIPVESSVRDWKYNFRLGVFNEGIAANITNYEYTDDDGEIQEIVVDTTDYNNLTLTQIIENTVWSDAPSAASTYSNLTCTFRYNPDYPLYIVITGDNLAATTVRSPRFTEPVIVESMYYKGEEPNGIFPVPIMNTLTAEATGEMTVPALYTTNTLIYYDFDIDYEFGADNIVRGAMLSADVKGDSIAISSKLNNQGNETRMKSIVVDGDNFTLGGYGDNWGFKTDNIKDFQDWEVHLTPNNTILTDDIYFNMNNVRLSLFVDKLEGEVIKTYIDGEDLDYYGVFLTDLKIPEGLKTDTDYLKVQGTDYNDPYMQTIREKEIELEFDLGSACDIYGNTVAMQQLTKLLVNERDKYNKPIPKRLEFSHYPDVYWNYIMEESFTPELEISSYKCKVKLTIPDGTSYTKDEVRTVNQGYVDGLTHVNPTILIKPYNSLVQILDEDSKQHFSIGYTNYTGNSMRIDCRNRKVYLINDTTGQETDISKYVDRNSDWFRLLGYFNLQATGAIIQTVNFKERW